MSTGDEQDEVLVEDDSMENVQSSDIDKILELVDELKKKDLDEYKRKIDLKKQVANEAEIKYNNGPSNILNIENNVNIEMDDKVNKTCEHTEAVSDNDSKFRDQSLKDTCENEENKHYLIVNPGNPEEINKDKGIHKHFDLGESECFC